jgi:exosortase/archaeosortase family protein
VLLFLLVKEKMMKQKPDSKKTNQLSWVMSPMFQFISISVILLTILMVFVSQTSVSVFLEKNTTIFLNYLLNLLHFKTRLTGNMILLLDGSQIKFQIIQDCTGIYPYIILTSLIAAFPARLSKKILGILLAFVYTFLFNYLRLILLFVIGRSSAKWFEIAHIFIWQVSFVLLIVIFFFWWVQWAKNTNKLHKI